MVRAGILLLAALAIPTAHGALLTGSIRHTGLDAEGSASYEATFNGVFDQAAPHVAAPLLSFHAASIDVDVERSIESLKTPLIELQSAITPEYDHFQEAQGELRMGRNYTVALGPGATAHVESSCLKLRHGDPVQVPWVVA